jgi:hypothetical protein
MCVRRAFRMIGCILYSLYCCGFNSLIIIGQLFH